MNRTILIVEDDYHIALALKIRFGAQSFDVTMVSDIKAASAAVAELDPAVAIVDYNLPDGNGIDWVAELSSSTGDRHPHCIITTASRLSGLKARACAAGAVMFIEKPFSTNELISSVEYWCQTVVRDDSRF